MSKNLVKNENELKEQRKLFYTRIAYAVIAVLVLAAFIAPLIFSQEPQMMAPGRDLMIEKGLS